MMMRGVFKPPQEKWTDGGSESKKNRELDLLTTAICLLHPKKKSER